MQTVTSPEEEGGEHASNASNEDDLRHNDFNDRCGLNDHIHHDLNDVFDEDPPHNHVNDVNDDINLLEYAIPPALSVQGLPLHPTPPRPC